MEKEDLYEEPYVDSSVDKYKKKKKAGRAVLIAVLAVIACCYFAGVIYFSTHFLRDTTINGHDVSYMSKSEADELLHSEMDAYTLEIQFKNGTETLKKGDGTLDMKLDQSVGSLKNSQNPFIWFVNIFEGHDLSVKYNAVYDEDKLKTYICNFSYMKTYNMEPSENARVRMEDGKAVVVSDVTGTKLDADKVYDAVFAALGNWASSVNLDDNGCYIQAEITADSAVISSGVSKAESFLSIKAEYDFSGYIVEIPKEDLATLAYVDDSGNVVVSKTNVTNYAKKFAEKYSTSYTKRNFKTHDGKNIEVYGGYYGWQLDAEKEAEELYELLCKGEDFKKEPACVHKGYTYGEDNDIGDTYIEVDLSDQKVYAFVDGELKVETDCVSGNTSAGRNTPGGLFGLTYKATNVVLKGEDYESPVTYWMPFNGGIGLHDASWRSRFGGSIYYYSGSHGCVNLPYSAAAEIYAIVEPGMPIVCYWD